MKLNRQIILLTTLVSAILLFSTSNVKTNSAAPAAGGLAGDPSRLTCALIGCHPAPELAFGVGELNLNMGTTQLNLTPLIVQSYTPGQTYFIEMNPTVTNGNTTRYGFQITALDVAGNMAGSFTLTDAVNTSAQSLLSRNYVSHKAASSFHDWIFQWTAPATNAGKLTFYYTVNAADWNSATSGDKIYKGTTDLLPAQGTGINSLSEDVHSVQIFPNPVNQNFFLTLDKNNTTPLEISIYSLEGKLIQTQNGNHLQKGENTLRIDLGNEIISGIYMLHINSVNQHITREIVVM